MKIILIPESSAVHRSELEQQFSSGVIIACDFHVKRAEEGVSVPGGYELGRIMNVDHHAPTERMSRDIEHEPRH